MTDPNNPVDDVTTQDEAEVARLAQQSFDALTGEGVGDLRQRISHGCRLLAADGHAHTLAGQITARAQDGETFWTPAWRGGFANTRPETIVRIDANMSVLEGDGQPNPGVRFHLWIYLRRPDVHAIVHTHPPYASTIGLTGEPLMVSHMDSAIFHDDCAFLAEWPGLPLANEEGRIISEALGGKGSILLAHHGLLTIGSSLDEALYRAILLERACRVQAMARSIGPILPIDGELAAEAREFLLQPTMVTATVDYWITQLFGESSMREST